MVPFITAILNVLIAFIVARAILSLLVPLSGRSPHPILIGFSNFVNQMTEPMLGPIRRILPTMGMIDFSPMVAIIILVVIKAVVTRGV